MNQESKWVVISAIAAVASLFIPLILYFIDRDKKELLVETVSLAVPIDLSDPRLSALKVTYKDTPLDRLSVATIEFRNIGSKPIEQKDFEHPLRLRFQAPANILAATLSQKTPENLSPTIINDLNGISISPLLLNPGDTFQITVQTRGIFTEPTVESRISGVSSITRRTPGKRFTVNGYFQLIIGIAGVIVYTYLLWFPITALFHRYPYTALPIPESVLMMGAIGLASGNSLMTGLANLHVYQDHILLWSSFLGLMIVSASIGTLSRRRAMRYANTRPV